MAFNSDNQVTVLFRGLGRHAIARSRRHRPRPRASHAMAYEPTRRRTVLFGGHPSTAERA
ncbi:MAG: hypothetical protein SFV54_22670 [Bryobacteraceae bacterium]|nr:hypothetical protein [Bryobacteraceae bacterium]